MRACVCVCVGGGRGESGATSLLRCWHAFPPSPSAPRLAVPLALLPPLSPSSLARSLHPRAHAALLRKGSLNAAWMPCLCDTPIRQPYNAARPTQAPHSHRRPRTSAHVQREERHATTWLPSLSFCPCVCVRHHELQPPFYIRTSLFLRDGRVCVCVCTCAVCLTQSTRTHTTPHPSCNTHRPIYTHLACAAPFTRSACTPISPAGATRARRRPAGRRRVRAPVREQAFSAPRVCALLWRSAEILQKVARAHPVYTHPPIYIYIYVCVCNLRGTAVLPCVFVYVRVCAAVSLNVCS